MIAEPQRDRDLLQRILIISSQEPNETNAQRRSLDQSTLSVGRGGADASLWGGSPK